MSAAFSESLQATFAETMTPDSFLNWLLSREWDYRAARNIERLVKNANFRYDDASVAQIDYNLPRGLDRNQMERLASLDFIRKGENLFITGCSGTGKSYLATALGYEACKAGMRVLYANASKLMGTLKNRQKQRNNRNGAQETRKTQLLILDDLFLVPLDAKERAHLYGNHRRPPWSQINHRDITAPELTGTKQSVTPQWQMQYSIALSTLLIESRLPAKASVSSKL